MPIIDFPVYLDALQMRAAIRGVSNIAAYETVNGLNLHDGDLRVAISGQSALYGNIAIDGETFLGAGIEATSSFSFAAGLSTALKVDIAGQTSLGAKISYGEGRGWLDALVSYGAETEITSGLGYLPLLYAEADSWYVPPKLTEGYALLTGFTSIGYITEPNIGEAYLPYLIGQGWLRTSTDDPYTSANMVGSGYIGTLASYGNEGIRLEATFDTNVFSFDAMVTELDFVLVFSSNVTIADTYIVTRQLLGHFLSTVTATDSVSCLGVYEVPFNTVLAVTGAFSGAVGAIPATFASGTKVWVYNVENGGTTQYDNFAFNSFAKRGTEYLAAADDGIYSLGGATDFGQAITAEVVLALSRFATPQKKYFPALYLGVSSAGKMLLKATVEGTDWFFEANNTTLNMANQRIDLGKGLVGSHWQFTIMNQNGLDFDLESVEFLPLISTRRIY
jgi:hypothetical protein